MKKTTVPAPDKLKRPAKAPTAAITPALAARIRTKAKAILGSGC